ncbi:MAG: GldM family protein [Saprospiraceae bacterium]|nr:hypothetical protein [Lewinellaceae bacterium]
MKLHGFIKFGIWLLFFILVSGLINKCNHGRIVEAFAIIDPGLRNDHVKIQKVTKQLYNSIKSSIEFFPDSQNLVLLGELQHVIELEEDYYAFIEDLRHTLLLAANLSPEIPLEQQVLKNSDEIVWRVLTEPKSNPLQSFSNRTTNLRQAFIYITDKYPWHYTSWKCRDAIVDPSGSFLLYDKKGNLTNLPISGVLAILSGFQTVFRTSLHEFSMIAARRVGPEYGCDFPSFSPFVSPVSTFVPSGEKYEADIYLEILRESRATKIINVQVNGKSLKVEDGMAHYEANPYGVGTRTLKVEIWTEQILHTKEGFVRDTQVANRKFTYEVRMPHVGCELDNGKKYLYAGVKNPVSVSSWGGIGGNNIRIYATEASLENLSGGHYVLTPNSTKPVTLHVGFVPLTFAVRPIPNPIAVLAEAGSGRAIPLELLLSQTKLGTRFPQDFDFEANCEVVDFQLTRLRGREDPVTVINNGQNFGNSVKQLLSSALTGDRLLFEEIRVKCPGDRKYRGIDPLSIRVE